MKLTLKEYAKSRGVSYESVRKQIIRHSDELDEHITTENGTRYLTDQAQEILNNYAKKQVVFIESEETTTIRELKEQLEQERKENKKHRKEIQEKDKQIIDLKNEVNDKQEKILDIKEQFLDTQQQIIKEKELVYQSQFLITQKDEKLNLIATNRKERRKYIKGLKKQAKEEKKQAKEQAAAVNQNDTDGVLNQDYDEIET